MVEEVSKHTPGPLTGIRVLDFGRVLAAPHCGRTLRDLGAEVIKIEAPTGDMTRSSNPRVNSIATYFTQQNAGKSCISLDLSKPEGADIVRRLAVESDVVLENFRVGVMAKYGLGYEDLQHLNPRLIFCSITGFGATGPWKGRRAYAQVAQAESGYGWTTSTRIGRPFLSEPMSHGDVYSALQATIAILAALHQREVTGVGQHIDVSMMETLLVVNEHLHAELLDPAALHPDEQIISYQPHDYLVVTTLDGRTASLPGHPAENGTFPSFCKAFNCVELLDDTRFASTALRLQHFEALYELLDAAASKFATYEQLDDALDAVGLACGEIRSPSEAAATDWAAARGAIATISDRGEGTLRIPNTPWHFSGAWTGVRGEARYRGEDNRIVLKEVAGYSDDDIDRLEADGVLSSRMPKR